MAAGRENIHIDPLQPEILQEMAASLGHAGRRAEASLERLRAYRGEPAGRERLLKEATAAVYAYFIQRELCGMRNHRDVIREYRIPNEVLVRLGAS
jgi:hypothetical protein